MLPYSSIFHKLSASVLIPLVNCEGLVRGTAARCRIRASRSPLGHSQQCERAFAAGREGAAAPQGAAAPLRRRTASGTPRSKRGPRGIAVPPDAADA